MDIVLAKRVLVHNGIPNELKDPKIHYLQVTQAYQIYQDAKSGYNRIK